MQRQSKAWILLFGQTLRAAVGTNQLKDVVLAPRLFEIPLSMNHCPGLMVWQKLIVPVFDMRVLLGETKRPETEGMRVGVMGYQTPEGATQYGGLLLSGNPMEAWVTDDMACPLPAAPALWKKISQSCFQQGSSSIPILDLRKLFTESFDSAVSANSEPNVPLGSKTEANASTEPAAMENWSTWGIS